MLLRSGVMDIERSDAPYLQIVAHYRDQIDRGEIRPGQKLPSVREMARLSMVAHTTAARALKELQKLGYASSAVGLGTVACKPTEGREHFVYCTLNGGKVERTQELGSALIDWDADGEIVGVEILNVRKVTIDGSPA